MRKKDVLKKLEGQSSLLHALGKYVAQAIAERLTKNKRDEIGYTAIFVDEKHSAKIVGSSGILILRDLPFGPGYILAVIAIDYETTDTPAVQITSCAGEVLSGYEYRRFIDEIRQIANEMDIPFSGKIITLLK